MTSALTVIIPEATANASMRRFSASPSEKTARFRGGQGWRYQDICRGLACAGHSFAQLSCSRQSGKVSKMVISNEAALGPPKPATGYLTRRLRLTPNLSYSYGFQLGPGSGLLFNKMWYLDGDLLPHPLKFFIRSRLFSNKSRNHTD